MCGKEGSCASETQGGFNRPFSCVGDKLQDSPDLEDLLFLGLGVSQVLSSVEVLL